MSATPWLLSAFLSVSMVSAVFMLRYLPPFGGRAPDRKGKDGDLYGNGVRDDAVRAYDAKHDIRHLYIDFPKYIPELVGDCLLHVKLRLKQFRLQYVRFWRKNYWKTMK